MKRRITVGGLMLAVAAAGVGAGLCETGRRSAPPPPATVYVTRRGSHYHAAGCRYAAAGTPVRLDQVGGRYRPCAYCRPPAAPP